MAVTTPAGISSGGNNPLPIASATNRNIEPIKADNGNNLMAFGPANNLAIWGAIKPIKLIVPVTDTTEPTQIAAITRYIFLMSDTFSPKLTADSSPKLNMSILRAKKKISGNTNTPGIKNHKSS